jgi:GMP synthase-like glutamine amidotransferase
MRPIAVLQHADDVEPGYFRDWAQAEGLPLRVFRPYRGETVPVDPRAFSGICLMGGPMSVNDPLPWIAEELRLIRAADRSRRPVIGHCLGGQLIASAFGAAVERNPLKEIGWGRVRVTDAALAAQWLGETSPEWIEMFQWHGDTFRLPQGARNFLASDLCERQAFVVERDGYSHLGMQFHCEMTPALIGAWLDDPGWLEEVETERRETGGAGVQDAGQMRDQAPARCDAMNTIAARLYARWSEGLIR